MKFVDSVKLYVSSGAGGNGCVSWNRQKYIEFGGPDGGNGGNGGNVYIRGQAGLYSLYDLKLNPHQKAGNAAPGGGRQKSGRNGKDLIISVPYGTVAINQNNGLIIAEVLSDTPTLILKGGKGGLGNAYFKNSTRQAPDFATPGKPAQQIQLQLELKVIADLGLVGLPNAGKSTFINTITNANSTTADYPFTTLTPKLGVVKFDDFSSLTIADIPGLIKGASDGAGLGLKFLKHISRTKLLVFIIDSSSLSKHDPLTTYQILNKELLNYDPQFKDKKRIVLLNKIDDLNKQLKLSEISTYFATRQIPLFKISALKKIGLEAIKKYIQAINLH